MLVALLSGLVGASAARAQLQGHISMAKDVYLAGEPVYVLFELTNVGKEPVQFAAGDPYSEGCGGYTMEVSSGPPVKHSSCRSEPAPECIVGNEILTSGETRHRLLLVNYGHDVSKAGNYEIHATQAFKYGPLGSREIAAGTKEFKEEQRLQIRVLKGSREALEGIYRVYVKNLGSNDDEIQREAERAIVSGAPPWLEDTIVGMLRRYTSGEFALLGLKNLNTPRAREELAKLVQNTSAYTQESEMAVSYLGQMGDKKYFPMLLEIAKKQPADEGRAYVLAAAELGGDEAIPYLRGLLSSTNKNAQTNGVLGLEKTGSGAAVPSLIETLKSPDADLGKLAAMALTGLTHREMGDATGRADPPAEAYARWQKWWGENGSSATVYGPRECGEVEELP